MLAISRALDADLSRGDVVRVVRVGLAPLFPNEVAVMSADALTPDGRIVRYPTQAESDRTGLACVDLPADAPRVSAAREEGPHTSAGHAGHFRPDTMPTCDRCRDIVVLDAAREV